MLPLLGLGSHFINMTKLLKYKEPTCSSGLFLSESETQSDNILNTWCVGIGVMAK